MADTPSKLVAKSKYIIDPETYLHAPRSTQDYSAGVSSFPTYFYSEISNGNYFPAGENDKVRVVLGKNWDHRSKLSTASEAKVFSNNWSTPRTFFNSPVELEFCDGTFSEVYAPGSFGLTGAVIEENIILKSNVSLIGGSPSILRDWVYYMKTGVKTAGEEYTPIVGHKKFFFDHYHTAINPFTPEELQNKSSTGKAFFVDYKTFYNERTDSSDFESAIAQDPLIQNSLPNIYGFLKFLLNDKLEENNFVEFSSIIDAIKTYHDTNNNNILKFIYSDLLNKYPLETLTLLYGMIGKDHEEEFENNLELKYDNTKIVEKIISLSFDNFDADSLFSDYYKEYTDLISKDAKLKTTSLAESTNQQFYNNRQAF